ncbi:hypothetical protein BH11BAC1_BH11BAC1_13460 [soil metagenome]
MSPVILMFFILMDITIAVLIVAMKMKGMQGALSIALIMGLLALVSAFVLILFLKSFNPQA